jgi:hypothetical protein
LHQQLRSSEDAKLQNEISRLKGRVIELEATITNERCEKERLTSEKENYRTSANKLVCLLILFHDSAVTIRNDIFDVPFHRRDTNRPRCFDMNEKRLAVLKVHMKPSEKPMTVTSSMSSSASRKNFKLCEMNRPEFSFDYELKVIEHRSLCPPGH